MNKNNRNQRYTKKALSADELLQLLQNLNRVNIDPLIEVLSEAHAEKELQVIHSHKIWQNKSDFRWYTYIRDESRPKNRRLVSRKSRKKLLEFIKQNAIDGRETPPDPTILSLYPLWLDHKNLMVKESSIQRIQSDWIRFYENDPIVDTPIDSLTKTELEDWILRLIRDNEMTKTNYYNVSMIIRQIFQYAYDSEIIRHNTFSRVKKDLGKLFRKEKKPEDYTQIYTDEEIHQLEDYIWKDFRIKGKKVYHLAPLAVLFQLYTGMRISEVCVLKYSDILPDGKIHVQRMQVQSTGEVREDTKGFAGDRKVYLSEKALRIIIETLRFRKENRVPIADYIFSTSEDTFPARVINDYLQRYCHMLLIPYRSSHKLRKTAISSMVNAGVSLNAVKNFAGHTDEMTTLKYYTFDREAEAVRNELIEKALSFNSSEKPETRS